MKKEIKYLHDTAVHNSTAPETVVPLLIDIFKPASVLDVGCGIGTWLHEFLKTGVVDILGVDGDYVDYDLLQKYISIDHFKAIDLSKPFSLDRKFDLAVCLEVAEHLPPDSASLFIESIVKHSDIVIFGAAIPNQWGQNHLNEQWPEYWIEKFKLNGYDCYDILRPLIWDNLNVNWWYKQNILVFSKTPLASYKSSSGYVSIIHPEHFQQKISYINELSHQISTLTKDLNNWEAGKKSLKHYLKGFKKYISQKIN